MRRSGVLHTNRRCQPKLAAHTHTIPQDAISNSCCSKDVHVRVREHGFAKHGHALSNLEHICWARCACRMNMCAVTCKHTGKHKRNSDLTRMTGHAHCRLWSKGCLHRNASRPNAAGAAADQTYTAKRLYSLVRPPPHDSVAAGNTRAVCYGAQRHEAWAPICTPQQMPHGQHDRMECKVQLHRHNTLDETYGHALLQIPV